MATVREDGVFVSSVYDELIAYRKEAIDAVWRCKLYPVGMEREDIAKPETTSDASFKMLDESSVYVGIFAFRYGSVTVEELEYAEARKMPILIFQAEAPLNENDKELNSSHADDLKILKARLHKKYTVASFRSPEELGVKLQRSLLELREQGKVTSADAQREAIPHPPTPYYAHSYVAGSAGFVGRTSELQFLDAWAGGSEPMLLVDAIGGAGKSALAWEWTHTHLQRVFPQRVGVLWWSFYESNATMGGLLARALAYLSGLPLQDCARLSRGEQEEQLLGLLSQRPVALILDGVERLLLAYHRLDAPQLTDEAVSAAPRACIDPRDGTFLRALTRAMPSKILITTRLIPQDLQDRTGQLVQGVRLLELPGLSAQDALTLFEQAGVHGNHELIRTFLAQFGDHALLVQALAGRIRDYRPKPGDFDAWYQEVGRTLELDPQDLKARQSSVLEAALADLDPLVFRLLCQLSAFRYPVDYEAVVTLNPFRTGEDREEGLAPLHAALGTLEERGLLQWDRAHNRYDLHPVVRSYAYARLEDKQATFAQMKDYFERLPAEDTKQVQDVADLRGTLELYHALLNAGQADEAIKLYGDRLDALFYTLGAYTTIVELLAPLFRDGFASSPALSRIRDQSYTANEMALAFDLLGNYPQAQTLYALGARLVLEDRNAPNLATALSNLGDSLQESGQLAAAEQVLLLSLAVARVALAQSELDIAFQNLTGVYASTGAWTEGEASYAALQASPRGDIKNDAVPFIYAARLRWGQRQDPMPLLEQALTRARETRFPRAARDAQWLFGEVAFTRGDLAQAGEAWQAAYSIAQRQGAPLGPHLADLARLRAQQAIQQSGQTAALSGADARAPSGGEQEPRRLAQQLIAEALALGGRGVELAAVEVYLALGMLAEARQYVASAYREAWADGPPYAFAHELERARVALRELGMPEPQLPPFDPQRVPPVPYEDEIRAFIAELERGQGDPPALDAGGDLARLLPAAPVSGHGPDPSSNGKRPWWKFWSRT